MAKRKKKEESTDLADLDVTFATLVEWVEDADEGSQDTRDMAERSRDYYDGKQYTDKEIAKFKESKQAPIVVNRIKPKMDGLAGMERSNRTTAKAYPRTPKHEQDANAATEAVRYVLDDNSYRQVRSSAWDNLEIEGTAGIEVIVKPKAGESFDIEVNHIMWDRLIYDPHARRRDFGDARYKGQVIWLDYDIALERFPDGEDVLNAMFEGSSTYEDKPFWMDTKRKRVKIVELYYQKDGDVWYSCFTRGGYLKEPQKSPYVTETGETEDPYEFASLFIDRDGNRYGAAWQYLDVQDEINKRRSKALHLMSVRQVRWERGAVEDINKTRQELAKPDGVVETTPGMEFEVLKTGDMAQAQFKLLEDAKMEIDAVGYSAAASGKEERLMSGIALRNREAAAQTELAPMFDVLKHLDVRVYRKIWNRIKQYWREPMWLRVTDDPTNIKWVALNRKMTKGQLALEQAKASGAPPQQLAALQAQIAMDPSAQEPVTQNDIGALDVDIVFDDAPDSVTMQQEQFIALSEMVKSGIPIPPTAIVESSDLKNKDRILKEMREGMAIPPEMQEKLKKQEEEFAKLKEENQALKADQQTEMVKIQQKQQADGAEMQHKAMMQAEELRLERERAAAEIQLAREKAAAEIQLKQMQCDADLKIEGAKMTLQNDQTEKKMAMEHSAREKEMAFEQDRAAKEDEFKRQEKAKDEATEVAPQFLKALEKLMASNGEGMMAMAQAITKMAAAIEKGNNKTITLGDIRREDGMLVGATATVQ